MPVKWHKKNSLIPGRIRSFGHAFSGIWTVFKTQINFRIQLLAGLIAVGLSLWLQISLVEWIALIMACSLVLGAEAINTSIELLCDKIDPEFSESIKKSKDLAAAAVLIFSIAALIIGGIIFVPKLLRVFL